MSQKSFAQEDLTITGKWAAFNDLPNSLYRFLEQEALEKIGERQKLIDRISDLKGWQERQAWIRKTLPGLLGKFPARTELHARITGEFKKPNFILQNIVFESQPGYFVTSALYIPSRAKANTKFPAILYCSGHSTIGYREPIYQQAILNLVDKGFIVFAFDPIDQGERIDYPDSLGGNPDRYEADKQHSLNGAPLFVGGQSLCGSMIWDGIRALDYLLTRKEVDTSRIGVTGRSGGGIQSAFLAALDERIKAVAPESYITNFRWLIESSGPQDAEQVLVDEIAKGFDIADLLTARAPMPALVISTTRDVTFSIQGANETVAEVRRVYEAYGRSSNFQYVNDDARHTSTKKNREAMYAFFQKWLSNPGDSIDRTLPTFTAAELRVCPTGQVVTSYHSHTIFALYQKTLSDSLARWDAQGGDSAVERARVCSGYLEPDTSRRPVFTGRYRRDGYAVEKYFIKGQGDYVIPFLLFVPDKTSGRCVLYLHPDGKAVDAQPGGELERMTKAGITVLAPDLLGIGETGPGSFVGDSHIHGVSYNTWYLSIMLGKSIVGVRASDVVALAHLALREGWANSVYACALDELCPVLLHAAAFNPVISRVALLGPMISYRSFISTEGYNSKMIYSLVPGSTRQYDLPALAAALAPRKLAIRGFVDGAGSDISPVAATKTESAIRTRYQKEHAWGNLIITSDSTALSVAGFLEQWYR